MTKQEIISEFGKDDGYDEDRYEEAIRMSRMSDNSVYVCFKSLINLEDKGYIELAVEYE